MLCPRQRADQEYVDEDDVAPDLMVPGPDDLGSGPVLRPQTKQELNKIRESVGNTQQLCVHFYRDRSLRDDLLLVSTASQPTMAEYQQTLLDQKTQDRTVSVFITQWVSLTGFSVVDVDNSDIFEVDIDIITQSMSQVNKTHRRPDLTSNTTQPRSCF